MTLSITWLTEDVQSDGGENSIAQTAHVLEFDAVLRESHQATAEMTEHTVEDGADISDHKVIRTKSLTLETLVTNTPVSGVPLSGFAQSAVTASVQPATEGSVLVYSAEFDRVSDVLGTLERLRAEPIDVTVETARGTYPTMQLVSYSISMTEDIDAIPITLELKEVLRAATRVGAAPLPREPRGQVAAESSAEPEPTETPEPEDRRSTLAQAQDAVLGFFR